MSRILLGSAGILPIAISLISLATTTAADAVTNLNGTDGSMPNDSIPGVTSSIVLDALTPDSAMSELSGDWSITDNPDGNTATGYQFTQAQTTISDNIMPGTMQTIQTNNTEQITTSHIVNNTTQNFNNSTPSASVVTASKTPTSNTTLAILTAADEEKDSLRREATSFRIAVIVVSVIAGLSIVCILILSGWLIIQRRKQNSLLTESGIEMKRQQRQLQKEKWPEMRRISSSDDVDSGSRISEGRTAPGRAPTPAVSSEIYLDPDYPAAGVTSMTLPESHQYHDPGTYENYKQDDEYYNQSSQDNEYYNQSSQDNEYYNQSSQDNEVSNNVSAGLNQAHSLPRREVLNTRPPASSSDMGIYSNYKNG